MTLLAAVFTESNCFLLMMMYSPTRILLLCAHHTCQKVIAMNQRYPFSRKECRWWYLWCVVPLFLLNSEFESKPDCRLGKQFYMVVWDIGMVSWCVRCWLFVGSLVHSFSSSSCGERFIFKMSKCLTRLKMSPIKLWSNFDALLPDPLSSSLYQSYHIVCQ